MHAGRYHSLCACQLPDCLEETAEFEGIVMGIQHKELPIYGVQFHPESILTPTGGKVIENMLRKSHKNTKNRTENTNQEAKNDKDYRISGNYSGRQRPDV